MSFGSKLAPRVVFVLGLLLSAVAVRAKEFHVSPAGTASGDGSERRPWNLATALAHPPLVKPGDTIWLREGTYVGRYSSYLSGTPGHPIIVRQHPGERARIDGGPGPLAATLTISGRYTWYWGFEVFSSSTTRQSGQNGSAPTDLNRGATVHGAQDTDHAGIKLINLVLHDGSEGITSWITQPGVDVYGNLIYNNGWDGATDRGHGHGVYTQNQTGTKTFSDNIVFNNYGEGIIAYGSEAAYLDNIAMTGNTLFCNGAPSRHGRTRNLLFGGGRIARHGVLQRNYTYYPRGGPVTGVYIGYSAGASDFVIEHNVFVAVGARSVTFGGLIANLKMFGNHFLQGISGVSESAYPSNTYHRAKTPTGAFVYVRPNAYEPGRANITVYNWDRRATVDVDLSGLLAVGATYEVRNAQDFFSPAVLSGAYPGGPLRLPMAGLSVAAPIGGTAPPATGPEFNAFVLLTRTDGNERRRAHLPPDSPPPLRTTSRAR